MDRLSSKRSTDGASIVFDDDLDEETEEDREVTRLLEQQIRDLEAERNELSQENAELLEEKDECDWCRYRPLDGTLHVGPPPEMASLRDEVSQTKKAFYDAEREADEATRKVALLEKKLDEQDQLLEYLRSELVVAQVRKTFVEERMSTGGSFARRSGGSQALSQGSPAGFRRATTQGLSQRPSTAPQRRKSLAVAGLGADGLMRPRTAGDARANLVGAADEDLPLAGGGMPSSIQSAPQEAMQASVPAAPSAPQNLRPTSAASTRSPATVAPPEGQLASASAEKGSGAAPPSDALKQQVVRPTSAASTRPPATASPSPDLATTRPSTVSPDEAEAAGRSSLAWVAPSGWTSSPSRASRHRHGAVNEESAPRPREKEKPAPGELESEQFFRQRLAEARARGEKEEPRILPEVGMTMWNYIKRGEVVRDNDKNIVTDVRGKLMQMVHATEDELAKLVAGPGAKSLADCLDSLWREEVTACYDHKGNKVVKKIVQSEEDVEVAGWNGKDEMTDDQVQQYLTKDRAMSEDLERLKRRMGSIPDGFDSWWVNTRKRSSLESPSLVPGTSPRRRSMPLKTMFIEE